MTKKKSIWAFLLTILFILPAMFFIVACDNDTINTINGANNIIAEGKFGKGSTLSSDIIETSDSSYSTAIAKISDKEYDEDKVAVFDITLANSKGSKIQPDGKVKITMPKPFESEHGYITYHIKDNTTVEELETILNGTNIVFETESFSYFVVVGKVPPTNQQTFIFSNTHADSLNHLYNGTAVFVSKEDITIDGTKLSEITDENILSNISYVWRDKNTKTAVALDKDITLTGEINTHYGVNRDITIGNEIAGPCIVGEYEFVLSYNGTEKLVVEATITESNYQKITKVSHFDATTAPTVFGKVCYYTIVGYANGQTYVMQMPMDGSSVTSDIAEAQARLVTTQEDGSLVLGGKFDFVFTPMRYFYDEEKHYPAESTAREDLLVDFCTGFYGARTATIGLATQVINRIGWTSLSGDKIARYKEEIRNTDTTYGNLAKFAEDGAVTIYAPRKGATENNALRLVKNADGSFAFTGVDKTTDTRESFPIYVYKQYVKQQGDTFEFLAKLDKQYDGNPVQFNCHIDLNMNLESKEDIGAMLKMETVRFVFKDLKDNIVMTGSVNQEDGTVTGPSTVGQYKLVIQFLEKGDNGNEWVDKAVLNQFEIRSAS